jgi:hypothetical protein
MCFNGPKEKLPERWCTQLNEQEALQVLLVKAFETQAPDIELLSEAERREATRVAIDSVGPQSAPDTFVATRAHAASMGLAKRLSIVNRILEQPSWHPTLLLLAIGIGVLVGITADVFGSGRQLNLLAPPAWLVILWNLGVYIVLGWRLFEGEPRKASPRVGWTANAAAAALRHFRFRHLQKLALSSAPSAQALIDFGRAWSRASLPLATTRLVVLLHAAAAGVAVAIIAGMYLRGMAFDYRVGWGSTFLDTEGVHTFLSWSLAPALWLSGIQLPDVAQMEALRDASGLDRSEASAAPWIHLYAIMLFITVVVPRTLLASWSGWQARRLSEHFPLSLDEQYYRNILRARRNDPIRIHVLPYAQALTEDAQQNLRRLLELAFDNSPQIVLAGTTPLGGEDDLSSLRASLADTTHLVALFDMTTTPETEYHGAFLSALAAAQVPVIVVVNESSFASRFRDYPQRLTERREAWTAFCGSAHKNPLFFDLASAHMNGYVTALRSSVDELTAA